MDCKWGIRDVVTVFFEFEYMFLVQPAEEHFVDVGVGTGNQSDIGDWFHNQKWPAEVQPLT